ncbi:hypothetical protein J3E69DRAFT_320808 [Trichoderma sp. SZMC 28015]
MASGNMIFSLTLPNVQNVLKANVSQHFHHARTQLEPYTSYVYNSRNSLLSLSDRYYLALFLICAPLVLGLAAVELYLRQSPNEDEDLGDAAETEKNR